jgi:TDG/mug DNA glycosylase family protein
MTAQTVYHELEPVYDGSSRVLILGTMPGVQSLLKQEYYGYRQNAFWKIIYSLFDEDLSDDYEQKIAFLLKHKIALWDVLESCEREGSADADIKNPIPNDIPALLKEHANIEHIYFNGGNAEKLFKMHIKKKINDSCPKLSTLPSTSPANAVPFTEKLKRWEVVKLLLNNKAGT